MSVDDRKEAVARQMKPCTGESETITRTVPRTQMIKSCFEACAIDVHNHLRQDGLGMENAIGTSKWWFRLMCNIFGMIEVDTFKTFYHFNPHIQVPSRRNYVERLVIKLLTISKGGSPEPTPFHAASTQEAQQNEDEDSDVECAVEHQIKSITQYLNARDSGSKASKRNSLAGQPAKRRNSKELAKEHRAVRGTAVRCKHNIFNSVSIDFVNFVKANKILVWLKITANPVEAYYNLFSVGCICHLITHDSEVLGISNR
ncbi:hypothetical protein EMCRGX_G022883 [Ephydatia muelleri]